jgi:hypothetical protein
MRQECASLKTAVAIHEQRSAALEDALLQRNDVVLEVHATRTQQCDQNEILMGSIEIVNGWPVNRQGRMPFEFRGEEQIEVQVTGRFNLFNLFIVGNKERSLRLDHRCLLKCAQARKQVREMDLEHKKLDLISRGLHAQSTGQYCSVLQHNNYATANVSAAYMPFNQITLRLFQDEGIPIRDGSIDEYRVLFRRILFFFYKRIVSDDTVVCAVHMRWRHG